MQLNKQSTRLAILRAELAAKNKPLHNMSADAFEHGVHMPADPPMPPSYWDDLEHWLKTLAPAKPAGQKQEPADVWHREDPPVPGVYVACHEPQTARPEHYAHWSGLDWTITCNDPASARNARYFGGISEERDYVWLRLIEADKPADAARRLANSRSAAQGVALVGEGQPDTELTHSVCITSHAVGVALHHVGKVVRGIQSDRLYPAKWRTCDESGWIPHDPKPDSVCPVPYGVQYEARYGDGSSVSDTNYAASSQGLPLWQSQPGSRPSNDIIAWRPIASKDAS